MVLLPGTDYRYFLWYSRSQCSVVSASGHVQPGLLKLFVQFDRHETVVPSSLTMGGRQFAGYALLLVSLHHTAYFILRSIPLCDWSVLVLKIIFSALLTFIFMLVMESVSASSGFKH